MGEVAAHRPHAGSIGSDDRDRPDRAHLLREGDPAAIRGPQRILGGEPRRGDNSRRRLCRHPRPRSEQARRGSTSVARNRESDDQVSMASGQPRDRSGSELSSMLTVDADHIQVRTVAADRPERDEPAVRRTAHPLRLVTGRKDRPNRSIDDIDRLELAPDRDDERPVRDRWVHRPAIAERQDGRQDEQDDETHHGHAVGSSMASAAPEVARRRSRAEATDPARIADTRGARPRQERRIGRSRELRIRIGRDVEAPDQGVHPLVSHLRFSAP